MISGRCCAAFLRWRLVNRNVIPIDDPFATDDGSYSIHKFYTRASEQGRTSQLRFSIKPSLYTMLKQMVAGHKVPDYGTVEDVLRDALVHRLHWVEQQLKDGKIKNVVDRLMWEAEDAAQRQEAEDMKAQIDDAENFCRQRRDDHDWPALRRRIDAIRERAEHMPYPWNNRMEGVARKYEMDLPDTPEWRPEK